MAEEVIGFRIDVGTEGGQQSIGALRRELSEAKIAMDNAKAGSKEFADSFQRYAAAKNNIRELNEEIRRLNPQKLSQQFVTVGQAVTSGFAAAQGAAALFGAQSEDAAKALLKVQAAMALAQGWRAIHEGAEALGSLRTMALAAANGMGVLKSAIIATGIGALVVAIGALVYIMDEQAEATDRATEALKRHNDAIDAAIKDIKYYSSLQNTGNEKELALAKIRGASLEEQWRLEKRINEEKIKAYEDELALKGSLLDADFLTYKALKDNREIIDAQYQKKIEERNKEAAEKYRATPYEILELDKKAYEFGLTQQANYEELSLAQYKSTEQAKLDFKKRIEAESKRVAEENAKGRLLIEQSVFGGLTNLGNTFIKNQEKVAIYQKKLAAVNIIVQQAEALSKAVSSAKGATGIDYIIQVASGVAAVTAIFAQIKTILSKAGDIGSAPSLDAGGVSAPSVSAAQSFTPNESTDLTAQGQSTSTTPQQQTVRAWVVESDITMTQDRVNKLQTWAKFG